MRRKLFWLAGVALLTAAVRIPLLGIPLERDEGGYAYIAWRSGLGELPYRDWIDEKPPGIFWIYQLSLKLPLEATRAIHVMGLIFVAASAAAFFLLASRLAGRFGGWMAAILFVLLSADPLAQGPTANTELFLSLPLLLGLLAALSAAAEIERADPLALLAGALIGIAMTFKQVAVLDWPLLSWTYWLFAAEKGRPRRSLRFAAWSAAGAAAVWLSILAYFAAHHALNDFLYDVFTYNFEYIRTVPWPLRWTNCASALHALRRSQALIWLFAVIGLWSLTRKKSARPLLFCAGWLAASLAGASVSGYYYPHYFQPLIPPLCLAAAFGAESLEGAAFWKRAPARGRRLVLAFALLVLPVTALWPFLFAYSPREAIRKMYPGDGHFAEMPDLGRRLAQLTRPDDRVFVFGAEPELLFYARRLSATRDVFLFPLYVPYPDAKAKQAATADEVSAHRPAAALYLPNGFFFQPGSEPFFTRWSQSYLRSDFVADTYLSLDRSGVAHLIPAAQASASVRGDQRIFGALLVRKRV